MSLCGVNTTCDNTALSDVISPSGLIIALTYITVVFVLSLLSNGTVCVIFYKRPQLLTVSNGFVLNLICCELALSVLVLPFWLLSLVSRKWMMNAIWCQVQAYVFMVLVITTQLSLLVISVDRNYAIINSLRYPYVFKTRLAKGLIAFIWILGLTLALPPLFSDGEFAYQPTQFLCANTWMRRSTYTIACSACVFLIPFIVQTYCYFCIFRAAIKHSKPANRVYPSPYSFTTQAITFVASVNIEDSVLCAPPEKPKNIKFKAVRTILIIYGSYLVSWICYLVTGLAKAYGTGTPAWMDMTAMCLLFLSCVVNPIIYGLMNRNTRKEVWKYVFRATQRITGRESVFVDSDEYPSSTLLTNLSSIRHTSGSLFPVTNWRLHNLKPGCIKQGDMVTILEVSESDGESEKAKQPLNETTEKVQSPDIGELVKPDTEEIVLRPSELSKLTFKRCLSNGDMTPTFVRNTNRKFVHKASNETVQSITVMPSVQSKNHRVLIRSQSMGVKRNLIDHRRSPARNKRLHTALQSKAEQNRQNAVTDRVPSETSKSRHTRTTSLPFSEQKDPWRIY